jgi:hypothetical protein
MMNDSDVRGAAVTAPIFARAGDGLPAFKVPALKVAVVHHLPGRLRLRSTSLKGDARAIEEAREDLAQIEGMISVTANPCTGSLLLEYDPVVAAPSKVMDLLVARGYTAGAVEEGAGPGSGWADDLASAIKDWLIKALTDRLALAIIGLFA